MNTQSMRELQKLISVGTNGIQEELSILERKLTMLRSKWTGEAASAYEFAQTSWGLRMDEMNQVLLKAGIMTGGTVDRHLEARQKVAGLWQ